MRVPYSNRRSPPMQRMGLLQTALKDIDVVKQRIIRTGRPPSPHFAVCGQSVIYTSTSISNLQPDLADDSSEFRSAMDLARMSVQLFVSSHPDNFLDVGYQLGSFTSAPRGTPEWHLICYVTSEDKDASTFVVKWYK